MSTEAQILTELYSTNRLIKNLQLEKERLEATLASLLDIKDDGATTYHLEGYKAVLSTGYNYSVDRAAYSDLKDFIPGQFNPVTEKIMMRVDNQIIKDAEKYADTETLKMLAQFISKKPKKLHIKLEKEGGE